MHEALNIEAHRSALEPRWRPSMTRQGKQHSSHQRVSAITMEHSHSKATCIAQIFPAFIFAQCSTTLADEYINHMGTPRECRGRSLRGVNGRFTRHVHAPSRDLRLTKGSRVSEYFSVSASHTDLNEEFPEETWLIVHAAALWDSWRSNTDCPQSQIPSVFTLLFLLCRDRGDKLIRTWAKFWIPLCFSATHR